ncbi:MAG: pyrroline-5-carboxylate reductase [Sphingorhabdus sp.]
MPKFPPKFLMFGCGNMGGAMLRGWISGGVSPSELAVVDPRAESLPPGINVFRSAGELDTKFDTVFLGIKPQMLPDLADQIAGLLATDAMLVSILAGTQTSTLSAYFPGTRIVRLMPNLSAAIGKSPMGLFSRALDAEGRQSVEKFLAPLGTHVWLNDEADMNAVTALAGSGPAFVYRFIDALTQGGMALGLDANISQKLAVSMVEGAAILAANANEDPAQLAQRVTSAGGTTAAGLEILDADQALVDLVAATLRAASDRGAALAKETEKSG